jgi:hypothetical protein
MENFIVTFMDESLNYLDKCVIPTQLITRASTVQELVNNLQTCAMAKNRTITNLYQVTYTESLLDSLKINKRFNELFSNQVPMQFICILLI